MNVLADRDWTIPLAVGTTLALAGAGAASLLGWSQDAVTGIAMLGVVVGVLLRLHMHDYGDESPAPRARNRVQH